MKLTKKIGLGCALAFASIGVVAATSAVVVSCSSTDNSTDGQKPGEQEQNNPAKPEVITLEFSSPKGTAGTSMTLRATNLPKADSGVNYTYAWTISKGSFPGNPATDQAELTFTPNADSNAKEVTLTVMNGKTTVAKGTVTLEISPAA